MIAAAGLGLVRYHFQALAFIPNDVNDKGWIVGETRTYLRDKIVTSAVMRVDGRQIVLGSYGGTGSAQWVNDRGHILIHCEARGLPQPLKGSSKARDGRSLWRSAQLFWSKGKATYLGDFEWTGRLLNNDCFLARLKGREQVARVSHGIAKVTALPTIPARRGSGRSQTFYADMNESGALVGSTDFGAELLHAILRNRDGQVSDLHPKVEMHTGWMANFVNSRGDVLGYRSFDFSIGGGAGFIWRKGSLSDLPSPKPLDNFVSATSFNDRDEAVGTMTLGDSGSARQALQNQELIYPYTATATSHGMVWLNGHLFDLNDICDASAGCIIATTKKINNRGWIIGTAVQGSKRIGYVLTPNGRLMVYRRRFLLALRNPNRPGHNRKTLPTIRDCECFSTALRAEFQVGATRMATSKPDRQER